MLQHIALKKDQTGRCFFGTKLPRLRQAMHVLFRDAQDGANVTDAEKFG